MRSKYLANMRLLQGVQTRKNTVFSRFFLLQIFSSNCSCQRIIL